jgi:hypothetical protein
MTLGKLPSFVYFLIQFYPSHASLGSSLAPRSLPGVAHSICLALPSCHQASPIKNTQKDINKPHLHGLKFWYLNAYTYPQSFLSLLNPFCILLMCSSPCTLRLFNVLVTCLGSVLLCTVTRNSIHSMPRTHRGAHISVGNNQTKHLDKS